MSGTHRALRLIERISAHLFDALACPEQVTPGSKPAGEPGLLEALYRAAWIETAEPLPLSRIAALARGLPANIVTDLTALPDAAVFDAPAGRIVLNLLLLAADSLPAGGTISLAGTVDDVFVRIEGSRAAWPSGLALCLVNESEALNTLEDGRRIQMAFTALLAHASGIRLSSLLSPSGSKEPAILRLGR